MSLNRNIEEFVPQKIKDRILEIIKPEFVGRAREVINNIENSTSSEEYLDKAVNEISSLVYENILEIKGKSYSKFKFLKKFQLNKIKKDVKKNLRIILYYNLNFEDFPQDRLKSFNSASQFRKGENMSLLFNEEYTNEVSTLFNKISSYLAILKDDIANSKRLGY